MFNHNKHTGNTIIPYTGKIQATQSLIKYLTNIAFTYKGDNKSFNIEK